MNSRPAARALSVDFFQFDFLDLGFEDAFGGCREQAFRFFEERAEQHDVGGLGRTELVGHGGGGDTDDACLWKLEVLGQSAPGCKG